MKKLLALLMATSMLFACSNTTTTENSSGDSDTIKIGGLAPLTGDVSIYGTSTTNGIKIAINEINENEIGRASCRERV